MKKTKLDPRLQVLLSDWQAENPPRRAAGARPPLQPMAARFRGVRPAVARRVAGRAPSQPPTAQPAARVFLECRRLATPNLAGTGARSRPSVIGFARPRCPSTRLPASPRIETCAGPRSRGACGPCSTRRCPGYTSRNSGPTPDRPAHRSWWASSTRAWMRGIPRSTAEYSACGIRPAAAQACSKATTASN